MFVVVTVCFTVVMALLLVVVIVVSCYRCLYFLYLSRFDFMRR